MIKEGQRKGKKYGGKKEERGREDESRNLLIKLQVWQIFTKQLILIKAQETLFRNSCIKTYVEELDLVP